MISSPVWLLATTAFAATVPTTQLPLTRASGDLEACAQAVNCEIVEANNATLARIRHTPDMGPGSDYLHGIMKRADDGTVETQVTLADAKVGYGCEADDLDSHPDPHAMLGNIDKLCKGTGACVQGEKYEEEITVVDCSVGVCVLDKVKWSSRQKANIHRAKLRNAFVEALMALAGTGVERKDQGYQIQDGDTGTIYQYSCKAFKQTGEYHISRFVWIDGQKVLQGFVVAKVSIPAQEGGMCDALGPAIAAGEMSGAIPGIGGTVAGIFGAVSAACDFFG